MIPSSQEILYRVYGAWRLARFDSAGAQYFDSTPQAALRSFFCAVLVAPAFFIAQFLELSVVGATTNAPTFLVLLDFFFYYLLYWAAPPVIIHRVCQIIDREEAFFRYLSANNWASFISVHLVFLLALVLAGGFLPNGMVLLLTLAVQIYVCVYQWFIFRHCLDVSPLAAVGFVALQVVLVLLIDSIGLGIVIQTPG
jgi:hypothetical protein